MKTYSRLLLLWCCVAILGRCQFASAQTDVPPEIDSATFYRSTLAAAEKAIRLQETREAKYWLSHSPATLRGWEWEFLGAQTDMSSQVATLGEREATGIDVASNAALAAISFSDGTVALYSLPELKKLRDIARHDDAVYSVKFSSDGSKIVTVARDVTSRIWDVGTGEEMSRISLDNPGVAAATFSPDGRLAATCSWLMTEEEDGARQVHGVVWIWETSSGKVIHKTRVGLKPLDSIAWSTDGEHIAIGSWDGYVQLLSKDAQELARLQVPDEGIYNAVVSVAISANGKRIACGSKDRTARVWDAENGRLVATMAGHDGFVTEVCFSSTDSELWTASTDGTIRQWDIERGKQLAVLRGHEASVVGFSPVVSQGLERSPAANPSLPAGDSEINRPLAESQLCSVSLDGTLRSWRAAASDSINLRRRLDNAGTYTTVWSPDGERIYVACFDGTVQVIDSRSGSSLPGWAAHEGNSCNTLSLSADGRRLLTCSWDKTARLWNPLEHKLLTQLKLDGGCYDCSLSPDGRLAALAVGNRLEIWNLETGELIASRPGYQDQQLTEVSFSPDGQRVAAAGGNFPAIVWDFASQPEAAELRRDGVYATSVCWSPTGDTIATGGGGWVDIWNAQTLEFVRRYRTGNRSPRQLAFSPDGSRLFAAAESITVIDPSQAGTLLRFQPCDDDVYYLSVAPDGRRLASCTTGGLISIASSGQPPMIP